MAITEEDRHRLFQRLEEVLGREQATTLMEHLPPVGWADVATKRDLDHQSAVIRLEIERLGDRLRAEWRHELQQQVYVLVGANVAVAAAVVAAIRL